MACRPSLFVRSLRFLLLSAVLAAGGGVGAQPVFKVTAIPDESPTELARKAVPLVKYLEQKLGMKVEFTPVSDYAAAVEALANKQVDMAWYGGFTFVQANIRSGGKAVPLVQREEDEKFRSVFISGNPAIKTLADLRGKTVSFGSQSSTSGHLMPRSFLLQPASTPTRTSNAWPTPGRTTPPSPPWRRARWMPAHSTSRCGKNSSPKKGWTPARSK